MHSWSLLSWFDHAMTLAAKATFKKKARHRVASEEKEVELAIERYLDEALRRQTGTSRMKQGLWAWGLAGW